MLFIVFWFSRRKFGLGFQTVGEILRIGGFGLITPVDPVLILMEAIIVDIDVGGEDQTILKWNWKTVVGERKNGDELSNCKNNWKENIDALSNWNRNKNFDIMSSWDVIGESATNCDMTWKKGDVDEIVRMGELGGVSGQCRAGVHLGFTTLIAETRELISLQRYAKSGAMTCLTHAVKSRVTSLCHIACLAKRLVVVLRVWTWADQDRL